MLKRVPEPELMIDPEQVRAYSDAMFADAHDAFVAFGVERVGLMAGLVLDAGCGPADPTVRFARANPAASVVGVDGSDAMLTLARERVDRAGLSERITFEERLLPDTGPGERAFDGAISNSLLHHLADPMALWSTLARVVRRGGPVVVMDLVRPDSDADVDRLVVRYACGAPEVLQTDYRNSLHAAYLVEEVQAQLEGAGLDHLEVARVTDRHLLVSGRR